jgi:hypothetical protein
MSAVSVNGGISLVVVLTMVVLFANAHFNGQPASLVYGVHPSTAIAFLFFGITWTFLLAFYWILYTAGDGAALLIWLLNNVAKLCLFAGALAYSRGKQFHLGNTAIGLVILLIILSFWQLVFWQLQQWLPNSMFVGSLRLAPDVIVSAVGIVLTGWVFFARWGGLFGWFFLLVTVAYAALQLPSILMLEFSKFLAPVPPDLNIVLSCLAGGKILLAFGLLSLICVSGEQDLDIDKPRMWPKRPVAPPKWLYHLGGWIVSFVTAIAVSLFTDPLKALIWHR